MTEKLQPLSAEERLAARSALLKGAEQSLAEAGQAIQNAITHSRELGERYFALQEKITQKQEQLRRDFNL